MHSELELVQREQGLCPSHLRCLPRQARQAAGTDGVFMRASEAVFEGDGAAEVRPSSPSSWELGEAELDDGSSVPENTSRSFPRGWQKELSMIGGYQI